MGHRSPTAYDIVISAIDKALRRKTFIGEGSNNKLIYKRMEGTSFVFSISGTPLIQSCNFYGISNYRLSNNSQKPRTKEGKLVQKARSSH